MSRKQQDKKEQLAFPQSFNENLVKAAILKVLPSGDINLDNPLSKFLLNPASYEETKNVNWSPQSIPGQSDPVLQFVNGGPRIITFEAFVTRDTSEFFRKDESFLGSLVDGAISIVGNIASSFAGVSLPPITDLYGGATAGSGNDLSISPQLNYYRSLLYPEYANGILSASPPLVVMATGDTFSYEDIGTKLSTKATMTTGTTLPVWVVTSMNIRVTKQLPNLNPMEAFVTFTLMEYIINSRSSGEFGGDSPLGSFKGQTGGLTGFGF